jgi:hypothetical protein
MRKFRLRKLYFPKLSLECTHVSKDSNPDLCLHNNSILVDLSFFFCNPLRKKNVERYFGLDNLNDPLPALRMELEMEKKVWAF